MRLARYTVLHGAKGDVVHGRGGRPAADQRWAEGLPGAAAEQRLGSGLNRGWQRGWTTAPNPGP